MTALTTSHLGASPPLHPAVASPDKADNLFSQPSAADSPPPALQVDYAQIHAAGLAARRHAHPQLATVGDSRDGIDAAADQLNDRIAQLNRLFGL